MPELGTPTRPRRKFTPYRLLNEREAKIERLKRQAIKFTVLGIIALACIIYGYVYYNSFFERSADARVATQSSALTAKAPGKVAKFLVKDAQVVKAGDSLVQIDPQQLQATLGQREQELDQMDKRLEGGKVYLERLQKASGDNDAAKQKYEDARKWYYKQQAKAQELRNSVNEARAQVKAAILTAPADGHVAKRLVDAGATVAVGQPLIEFVGTSEPWLVAQFKESQLEKMHNGQRAEVRVSGLPHVYVGTLENLPAKSGAPVERSRIERMIDFLSSRQPLVPVRIKFDPKSIAVDANRFVNGAQADVKVYIK